MFLDGTGTVSLSVRSCNSRPCTKSLWSVPMYVVLVATPRRRFVLGKIFVFLMCPLHELTWMNQMGLSRFFLHFLPQPRRNFCHLPRVLPLADSCRVRSQRLVHQISTP